jgi:hypothetical protein
MEFRNDKSTDFAFFHGLSVSFQRAANRKNSKYRDEEEQVMLTRAPKNRYFLTDVLRLANQHE